MLVSYSAKNSISSDLRDLTKLSPGTRAYFQSRLKRRLYTLVLEKFRQAEKGGLTKAELARRIGKKPEVITRSLQTPGNWRIETVSDLLLGICGEELIASALSPLEASARNYKGADIPLPKAPPVIGSPPTSSAAPAYTITIHGVVPDNKKPEISHAH